MVGNIKGQLNLGGQYINFPGYAKPGHYTMSALYSTFLNCARVKQQTFGQLDDDLDVKSMQAGPLPQILA